MQPFAYLAIVGATLLAGVSAVPTSQPTSLPGHKVCSTFTTITTTVPAIGVCHPMCIVPTSTCKLGEPTAPPLPTITTSQLSGCTIEVELHGECNQCATCVPAPTPTPLV